MSIARVRHAASVERNRVLPAVPRQRARRRTDAASRKAEERLRSGARMVSALDWPLATPVCGSTAARARTRIVA